MIDLEGIKAFIAVADTRSFSVAAGRLHLTQPAVSKRIALLENQMKVRLFDRIGRTVTLTEAGRELEPRAKLILTSIEDTRHSKGNPQSKWCRNRAVGTCDQPSHRPLAFARYSSTLCSTVSRGKPRSSIYGL